MPKAIKAVDRKEAGRKAATTGKQNALEQKQFEQEQIDRGVAWPRTLDELGELELKSIFMIDDKLEGAIMEAVGPIVKNLEADLRAALPKYGYAAVRGYLDQHVYTTEFEFDGWDNGFDLYKLLDKIAADLHLSVEEPVTCIACGNQVIHCEC
jgi:hypothetical protein